MCENHSQLSGSTKIDCGPDLDHNLLFSGLDSAKKIISYPKVELKKFHRKQNRKIK